MMIFAVVLLFAFEKHAASQSLAVNTDGSAANSSALLDVKSTNKGILVPRMTKAEKNAIAAPATGLLIFQNGPDSIGFHYYNGTVWTWLANSAVPQNWLTVGNSDVGSTNFLGTNNTTDLRLAVNTVERSRLSYNSGFWGFGGGAHPPFELDANLGSAAVFPCTRNGLRMKPAGFGNACDNGLFIGLDNNNSITNASVWNYGNNAAGAQNLRFGMNSAEISRFTSAIAQNGRAPV